MQLSLRPLICRTGPDAMLRAPMDFISGGVDIKGDDGHPLAVAIDATNGPSKNAFKLPDKARIESPEKVSHGRRVWNISVPPDLLEGLLIPEIDRIIKASVLHLPPRLTYSSLNRQGGAKNHGTFLTSSPSSPVLFLPRPVFHGAIWKSRARAPSGTSNRRRRRCARP